MKWKEQKRDKIIKKKAKHKKKQNGLDYQGRRQEIKF